MTEHAFKDKYRKALKKQCPTAYWWKINDSFQPGVPDAFVEFEDSECWIEFKFISKMPKRDSTVINLTHPSKFLSIKQRLWLNRREERYGDAFVIVGCATGAVLFSKGEWNTPLTTAEFKAKIAPISSLIPHTKIKSA